MTTVPADVVAPTLTRRARASDVIAPAVATVLSVVAGTMARTANLDPLSYLLFAAGLFNVASGLRTVVGRIDADAAGLTVRVLARTQRVEWPHVTAIEAGAGVLMQGIVARRDNGRALRLPVPRGVRGRTGEVDELAGQLRRHLTNPRQLVVQSWHLSRWLIGGLVGIALLAIGIDRPWQWFPRTAYHALPAVCAAMADAVPTAGTPLSVPAVGAVQTSGCAWELGTGRLQIAMFRFAGRGIPTGRMAATDALNDDSAYWAPINDAGLAVESDLGGDFTVERVWYPDPDIRRAMPFGNCAVTLVSRVANVLIVVVYTLRSASGTDPRAGGPQRPAATDAENWVRAANAAMQDCCPLI